MAGCVELMQELSTVARGFGEADYIFGEAFPFLDVT